MKRKNEQGFTLVEVIVVAVIVAVLAAVAIPLYNGYIRDSRTNVCQNNAATIASTFTAKIAQNAAYAATAAASSGTQVSVPSEVVGGPTSNIILPTGYTFSATATAVTVDGPGNSSASVNYQ
jgi:prepilin-type N-terminal cleavage/methylation domain-containing protein